MSRKTASKLFYIDTKAVKPKHRQIVDGVKTAIIEGRLKRNDILPTIGDVCETFGIARLTVLKAYEELQRAGLIRAENRKGYYVISEEVERKRNIFLLFDEFTMYKRVLYNAFRERIGANGTIDIFFHHYSVKQFESLILDNMANYTDFLVMPWPDSRVPPVIAKMDRKYTLLLDRGDAVSKAAGFSYIVQDHKADMVNCLEKALPAIQKYRKFILVHPSYSYHPKATAEGFSEFCRRHKLNGDIYTSIDRSNILPDTAYFVVDDNELVIIVEQCMSSGYELGKTIGVLSYNETPMKRIIANGISVVSTDFAMMGVRAADYILTPQSRTIGEVIPTQLIMRSSL
ncbi:MAG: GntR family transcriptional regulator [Chitinispirillaceae bacterium]|nr:GntR family transcriptional regulator [Chitinispirillaceae bacterium]